MSRDSFPGSDIHRACRPGGDRAGVRLLLSPPVRLQDDAAIDSFIDQTLGSYHHVSGTAKMGDDTTSVVDLGLRVRGIEGIRVIDVSVLPSIPTVNINATVVAVAERGAELIISEAAKRSQADPEVTASMPGDHLEAVAGKSRRIASGRAVTLTG